MSDHLPECPYRVDHPTLPRNRGLICICTELRACEQRVQETNIHSLLRQEDMRIGIKKGRTAQFKEMKTQVKDAAKEGHAFGYAAALRDAVEAVDAERTEDPSWDGTNWNNALTVAREVIEALAERERNDWQNGSAGAETLTQSRGNANGIPDETINFDTENDIDHGHIKNGIQDGQASTPPSPSWRTHRD